MIWGHFICIDFLRHISCIKDWTEILQRLYHGSVYWGGGVVLVYEAIENNIFKLSVFAFLGLEACL